MPKGIRKNGTKLGFQKGNQYHKLRKPTRIYQYNFNFFKTIDTEEKAYWLGFAMADGYVIDKIGCHIFGIKLQNKDKEHLRKFLDAINADEDYPIKKDENLYKIRLCSFSFVFNLEKWGVYPKKTFYTKFPKIPEKLWRHFIRGVFDGDGCLHIDKSRYLNFDIAGTKKLLTTIQKILMGKCNLNKTKLNLCSKTYRMRYNGTKQVKRILDYLYKNATVYLDRKYKLYKQINGQRKTT